MAVRTSMLPLIARIRQLIGDAGGASEVFHDQQLQDRLDAGTYRQQVRYALLRPEPTLTAGGVLNYTDYYANVGDWEADETLYNGAYQQLTPATSDEIVGHWTFSLPNPGQYPPVMIVGKTYDLYAAAADLLEMRIALGAQNAYAVTVDGRTFHREQPIATWQALATQYRRRRRVRSIPVTRSDLATTSDTGMLPNYGINNVNEW